jgi:Na+/melibiose symporter-like transporter
MTLAYTTPAGWSRGALLAYAIVTNVLLMSIYSMNNVPYAALGGVVTADVNGRAKLNSVRFVAVNLAQLVVGGFTLPLVAKFSASYGLQRGWQITMTIWAVLCLVLFVITFATTCERVPCGFGLAALGTLVFYFLRPADTGAMIAVTIAIAACYAPTIPLIWAIYADVADYSELQTGRRFTGMTFATLAFALKIGLALGASFFLWIMTESYHYDAASPDAPQAIEGFRACSGLVVGLLFLVCTLLLIIYKLDKSTTLEMARELTTRRTQPAQAWSGPNGDHRSRLVRQS